MTEMLDVVDEFGNPTGQAVERAKAHAEGIRHRTSHVWLLRRKNGKVQILLQKRSANKASFPGCYDISSAGHIPAGDDYTESALRELREELGVEAAPNDLIVCGNRNVVWDEAFRGVPFHDRQYSRVFCLWCAKDEAEFVLQQEEVEAVRWMDLDECIAAVLGHQIRNCIYPGELEMVKNAIHYSCETEE